jgi:UDP-glucose 4-epimerase
MNQSYPLYKQVTVLGGSGFIGRPICQALIQNGYRVRIFDSAKALPPNTLPDIEVVHGDMTHPSEVIEAIADADLVFHLIHTTVPGSSMNDPVFDAESNVTARAAWLQRLPETNVKRIVYFSSGGTVYGRARYTPIDENHPLEPISSYGITKLAIEKFIQTYATLAKIDCMILRPSNIYGVGQRLDRGQGVIGIFAQRAVSGRPLEILGNGQVIRDYLHIDDAVSAVTALLHYSGPHRIFNLSSGRSASVLDIIRLLREQTGEPLPVVFLPARPFDVPVNHLNSRRLRKATGWEPRKSLEEGIREILVWQKSLIQEKDRKVYKGN